MKRLRRRPAIARRPAAFARQPGSVVAGVGVEEPPAQRLLDAVSHASRSSPQAASTSAQFGDEGRRRRFFFFGTRRRLAPFAEVDQLRRQGTETLVLGDLFPRALHRGRWNRACYGFPLDLRSGTNRGRGRSRLRLCSGNPACRTAGGGEGAGAQVAEGGEFLLDPVTPERIKL